MRTIAAAGVQDHTHELFNQFLLDEGDSAGLRDAVKEFRKDPMLVVLFRPAKLSVKLRSFLSYKGRSSLLNSAKCLLEFGGVLGQAAAVRLPDNQVDGRSYFRKV